MRGKDKIFSFILKKEKEKGFSLSLIQTRRFLRIFAYENGFWQKMLFLYLGPLFLRILVNFFRNEPSLRKPLGISLDFSYHFNNGSNYFFRNVGNITNAYATFS